MHDSKAATRSDHRPSHLLRWPRRRPAGARTADKTDGRTANVSCRCYHEVPPLDATLVTPHEDGRMNRERSGCQMRATRSLVDLLTIAVRDELPRVARTVGSVGANLTGRCDGRTGPECRREFEAWCAALGATLRPESTDSSGITHQRAVVRRYDGLVDIVVLADLFAEHEGRDDR